MSFAREVKDEIAQNKNDDCCKQAELSAFLQLNTDIIINKEGTHLEFKTINPAVARRLISLIKEYYKTEIELMYKKQQLTNNKLYIVEIVEARKIIEDFSMLKQAAIKRNTYISKICCKQAYLRGAFMVMGSINDPVNSYHLEIKCKTEFDAIYVQRVINHFSLNAKISKRRKELIVYVKEASKILDFLNIVGSKNMFFKYHNIMTNREFNNSVNRAVNCEIANEEKAVRAAQKQLEDIKIIEKILPEKEISEKMKQIISLRKKNPFSSFNELRILFFKEYDYTITKSGLNHRFRKIHETAIDLLSRQKQ